MQGGPGVEGGLGIVVGRAADLGGVPALGVVEVPLTDHGVLLDEQDVVGDVEQGRLRDGVGVEVAQLLDVLDVEALEGLLNGAPGGVAGPGVGGGVEPQGGIEPLADGVRPGVQEGQDEGDPDGAGQGVAVALLVEPCGDHGGAHGAAGGRRGGRSRLVQADGLGVHLRGQPLDLGQGVVALLIGRGQAATGESPRGRQGRECREGPEGGAARDEERRTARDAAARRRRAHGLHGDSLQRGRVRCQPDGWRALSWTRSFLGGSVLSASSSWSRPRKRPEREEYPHASAHRHRPRRHDPVRPEGLARRPRCHEAVEGGREPARGGYRQVRLRHPRHPRAARRRLRLRGRLHRRCAHRRRLPRAVLLLPPRGTGARDRHGPAGGRRSHGLRHHAGDRSHRDGHVPRGLPDTPGVRPHAARGDGRAPLHRSAHAGARRRCA